MTRNLRRGQSKKERSKQQERRSARKVGGRTQPASGALAGRKGDVQSEHFVIECRYTDAAQYIFKLADWDKLRKQAVVRGREPVMEVEFPEHGRKVYIISSDLFEELSEGVSE